MEMKGLLLIVPLLLVVVVESTWLILASKYRRHLVKSLNGSLPAADLPLAGKRILLVEDAPESQILISHILEKFGLEVDVAENGRKALDILNGEDFDVILMDMQMPVLDGYSTTEILRKSGYMKPIISLTAHAIREDQLKCLASGCNEVLIKPVSQAALIHTVSRYLN